MPDSPGCHAAEAPKTTGNHVMLNSASPSSSHVVLNIPRAPYFCPSRTKPWMLRKATSRLGEVRLQLLAPGHTITSSPASRKGLQELRVAHCNVSPEHEPFVVRLHDFSDLLDVIEINLADSYLVRQFFRLPLSELDGFV